MKYLSPSSIKKWKGEGPQTPGCPRRWGFNYLLPDNREPSTAAAEFGTEVHSVLDQYQREGTQPDVTTRAGALAVEGLHELPEPQQIGVYSETEFRILLHGIQFGGRRDLWDTRSLYTRGVPVLVDYKTCGDPQRALTPLTLPQDLAAIIYALGSMAGSACQEILLRWLYFVTRGRPRILRPVEHQFTWLSASEAFEQSVLPTAQQIWPIYTVAEEWTTEKINKELASCRGACHVFGRDCPYLGGQCVFGIGESVMAETTNSRVAELQAKILAKKNGEVAAVAAPAADGENKALAEGYPAHIAQVLANAPEISWDEIAKALGFDLAAERAKKVAAQKAASKALPPQTAPVNPPEATLAAEPVGKGKGKGKGSAVSPAQIPLDLSVGETAVYQVAVTRVS